MTSSTLNADPTNPVSTTAASTIIAARMQPLTSGATVGVLGGGQLGRYFVLAARQLGYRTVVLDPSADAPAMQVAERALVAAYDDAQALAHLADWCDAVTIEFENVPADVLEQLSGRLRVAPSASVVRLAQNRLEEKRVAREFGLQPVPHCAIHSASQIDGACEGLTLPAILKTATLGYDGKGQCECHSVDEVRTAFERFDQVACVLESRIELVAEISVVLARGPDCPGVCFPIARNRHVLGILESSCVPAGLPEPLLEQARAQALALADGLDYEGVLAIEFFVAADEHLYFNEMAPRPHNSGHYTLDATASSQFEQQVRMLCGLPAGDTRLLSPVAMVNLLGDLWQPGPPDWASLLAVPGACLHLYGKLSARPGRKMGHVNLLGPSADEALDMSRKAHRCLTSSH